MVSAPFEPDQESRADDLGDPLVNRLLLFDSLSMEFSEVRIPRDPSCPLCGDNPTIRELIDYEAFCGAPVTTLG